MDASAILREAALDNNFKSIEVSRPLDYTVDLGHLAIFDINSTIGLSNENAIRENIRDGVQVLVNSLWNQPTRISEDHTCILAALPVPLYKMPREKPIPKPKAMTKWEKFAKEKNIQKEKRSRHVYDEQQKDWIPRHGYKGRTQQEDWIIEVPDKADPFEDQFEKKRLEKKARVDKNKLQQQRNSDAALASLKGVAVSDVKKARKMELESALKITGKSTASMGKFDKKLDMKGVIKIKAGKQKQDSVVDLTKERELSSKVLKKILKEE